MAEIEIITKDGTVHGKPGEIKIERNEETETFFLLLEKYKNTVAQSVDPDQ